MASFNSSLFSLKETRETGNISTIYIVECNKFAYEN